MHIKYFPRVAKKDNNKHKKQLNKIGGRSRDGSTKLELSRAQCHTPRVCTNTIQY